MPEFLTLQITSVYLQNIKGYEEELVDLQPGLTAITGENGAGKSTIVEAVGYALFGYSDGQLAGLMREGHTTAEIRVRFVSPLDGREYESVRSFKKSNAGVVTTTPKLLDAEQGGVLAEGSDEVGKSLRASLGFGDTTVDMKSIFADVSGVPQGRLTADFIDTPQSRKRKFDPLLGTDDFRAAYDALRQPLSLIENRKAKLGAIVAAQEERLKDLPRVDQDIKDTKSAAGEVKASLERAVDKLEKARALSASLNAQREAIDRLKSEMRSNSATLKLIEASLSAATNRVIEAEKAAERARISSVKSAEYRSTDGLLRVEQKRFGEFQRLSAEISELEARSSIEGKRLERARADLDGISKLQDKLPELNKAAESQSELEIRLDEARGRAAKVAFVEARVAEIESDLEATIASKSEYEREVSESLKDRGLAAQVDDLQQQIADHMAAIAAVDIGVQELRSIEINFDGLTAEVSEDRRELTGVEQRIESSMGASDEALDLLRLRSALGRAIDRGARLADLYEVRLRAAVAGRRPELEETLLNTRHQLKLARAAEEKSARIEAAEGQIKQLSERIETQRIQAAQARTAEIDGRAAESVAITLAERIKGPGTPDPRTRLEIARLELRKRKSVEDEIAAAAAEISTSAPVLASLRKKIEPLVNVRDEFERLRLALESLRPEHEQHLRDKALAENLPALIDERDSVRAGIERARIAVERSSRLFEKEAARFDPESLSNARDSENAIQVQVGGFGDRLTRFDDDLKLLDQQRSELLDVKRESEAKLQAIKRTETVHRVMQLIRNSLRDAGPEVTKAMVSGVSNAANEIFSEIMGNYAQSLQWDEEYGIWLESGGYRRSFRQLSGGEQITAALSVRLALLRDLLRIGTAFLDEPTQNLDATRRENLAEQIQRLTGFSQLFVISHDDTFERLLQSVIHVEKINGVSRVSR